jgi:3-hydroxyisobutyrate dehydrogenase-like beta-hydroxyacid dehydrogenase
VHVGDLGDGQRVKLVNNALFGANVGLIVEAERVAQKLGLDPARAFDAISRCSGNSYALGTAIQMGSAQQLLRAAGRYIEKDVTTAQEAAVSVGADLGVFVTVAGLNPDTS